MRRIFSSANLPDHDAGIEGTAEMTDPNRLRELASWYREFAVRSGVATISLPRLQMADDLDREADKLDPVKQDRGPRALRVQSA